MKIFNKFKSLVAGVKSLLTREKPQRAFEVWTDAGLSHYFNKVGCAAYIQEPGQEPYIIVSTFPRKTVDGMNSDAAEFQAISMAVEYLGPDASVTLHSDSKNAIKFVTDIKEGRLKSPYIKRHFSEDVEFIYNHPNLSVDWVRGRKIKGDAKKAPPIAKADEFAHCAHYFDEGFRSQHFERLGRQLDIRFEVL
jgi:ribonuclease HI